MSHPSPPTSPKSWTGSISATLRMVEGHGHISLVTACRGDILDLVRAAKGQR